MASPKEGLDTTRKNKNSDLAMKPAEETGRRLPASRSFGDVFQDMDRWFDDLRTEFERKLWGPLSPFERDDGLTVRSPLVDLADNGHEYVLTAELPGVTREDLDLQVTPDRLELAAEASGEREETGKDHAYRERTYESFRRRLAFPEEVLADQAEAKLKDGVLEVRLPKKEPTPTHPPVQVRVE